jgi:hypothetical protein
VPCPLASPARFSCCLQESDWRRGLAVSLVECATAWAPAMLVTQDRPGRSRTALIAWLGGVPIAKFRPKCVEIGESRFRCAIDSRCRLGFRPTDQSGPASCSIQRSLHTRLKFVLIGTCGAYAQAKIQGGAASEINGRRGNGFRRPVGPPRPSYPWRRARTSPGRSGLVATP